MSSNVAEFFAHHDFSDSYNPRESAFSNLQRLCQTKGWRNGTTERTRAEGSLKQALLSQFNKRYGEKETLEGWQAICEKLGVNPVPKTLKAAREKVRTTHFNLVDLAEADERPVPTFRTQKELDKYTDTHGLYFTTEAEDPCITGEIIIRLLEDRR
ncbi:hypothetical protein BKA70DRAFT_1556248 [Coprinopsis sp. MPI-PUGE-AT-0042]|nr:hypothetical protein BKA70DRAFT_1556248 [Coprinopsis sp. MPI-PUGE-AT-0042]